MPHGVDVFIERVNSERVGKAHHVNKSAQHLGVSVRAAEDGAGHVKQVSRCQIPAVRVQINASLKSEGLKQHVDDLGRHHERLVVHDGLDARRINPRLAQQGQHAASPWP